MNTKKKKALLKQAGQIKQMIKEYEVELKASGAQRGYLELLVIESGKIIQLLVEEVKDLDERVEAVISFYRPIA